MESSQIRYTTMFEDLEKELEDLDNIFENSENLKNYCSPEENGNFNFLVKQAKISAAAGTTNFFLLFLFILFEHGINLIFRPINLNCQVCINLLKKFAKFHNPPNLFSGHSYSQITLTVNMIFE